MQYIVPRTMIVIHYKRLLHLEYPLSVVSRITCITALLTHHKFCSDVQFDDGTVDAFQVSVHEGIYSSILTKSSFKSRLLHDTSEAANIRTEQLRETKP